MQRFSCMSPRMERFSLDLPEAVRKECAFEVGCGICVVFVVAGKIFFDFVI